MSDRRDRGLHAVALVREVRERDSRAGLLQALATVRHRETELAAREQALAEASTRASASVGEYAVHRQFLDATATSVRQAQRRLEASTTVATEARSRWQADKTRVRAIDHLLELRAQRARAEALRAEVRETDDIVGARHAARHVGSHADSHAGKPAGSHAGSHAGNHAAGRDVRSEGGHA